MEILPSAKKEWRKLPVNIKSKFTKKLEQRLLDPHVPKDKLSGMDDCYKIKLHRDGYRLVNRVVGTRLVLDLIAAGPRENNAVYTVAHNRL